MGKNKRRGIKEDNKGGKRVKKKEKGRKRTKKGRKNIHSLDESRAEEITNTLFLLCRITFRPEAEYKPTYATC